MIDCIVLHATCLFSKFGFHDGDILKDFMQDNGIECTDPRPANIHQVDFEDLVLLNLIKKYLIPRIPFELTLELIGTHHNPVRVANHDLIKRDRADGIMVTVSGQQIRAAIDEVRHQLCLDGSINCAYK